MSFDTPLDWPNLPYLGLRRFEASDRLLYSGRKDDIAFCCRQLASPSVRIMVLQGVSGSGKSSFLRAGLIPHLADLQKQNSTDGIVPFPRVIHADIDVILRISHEAYQFITSDAGRKRWEEQAKALESEYPSTDEFCAEASKDVGVLIKLLTDLSLNPRYTFLIAVDQVEELWTTVSGTTTFQKAREQFFRLVNEFARERLNGKLVLTIRTERYGIFASKLPDSTMPANVIGGVNRLCHHFLANPSREEMIFLVKQPAVNAASKYRFRFDNKLPERIVEDLWQLTESEETDICALPLLQIILKRLYDEGKAFCKNDFLTITSDAYLALVAHGARLNSIDILDGYLNFGLEKAIEMLASSKTSKVPPSPISILLEVNHWRKVVEILSQHGSQGNSLAELDNAARNAGCKLETVSVVQLLATPDIGILAQLDGSDIYTLRHDLLSLVFNRRPKNHSTEMWHQTFDDQRIRISEARDYSFKDLYGDDPPQTNKIQLAELRFWDHKVLAYASEQGFFRRLGIDTQLVSFNENITATELTKRLAAEPESYSVYSYPRSLMLPTEQKSSTGVVILNQFTGYAVVCNAAAKLPCLGDGVTWEKFKSIITTMIKIYGAGASFVAEDAGSANFFNQALELSRNEMRGQPALAINKLSEVIKVAPLTRTTVLDGLIAAQVPFVGIVTAPTWAIARMMEKDIKTVFDHRDLLMLMSQTNTLKVETKRQLKHCLSIHNVVNIQIPHESIGSEQDPLLMKLASVCLFLANCIWVLDDDVGKWIRERWIEALPQDSNLDYSRDVTQEVFLDTFRRSYRYVPLSEHFNYYYDSKVNLICNQRGDSDIYDPDDSMMALQIHNKLLQMKVDYQRHSVKLALQLKRQGEAIAPGVNELIERARKHAEICNYYDAERLLAKALELVDGASPDNG